MIFGREPVAFAGVVRAIILCVVAFGIDLSAEQIAAVMLVVEAILTVVTRQVVTPVADSSLGDTNVEAA